MRLIKPQDGKERNNKMKQTMRFNDGELALLKGIFENNEGAVMTLRKFLLQGKLTPVEIKLILDIGQSPTMPVIRKLFLPEIEADAPIGQSADLFVGVSTANKDSESVWLEIQMKQIVKEYLDVQFNIVEGKKVKPILLSDLMPNGKEPASHCKQLHINLGARNILLGYIDIRSEELKILANRKEESVEEKEIRDRKNNTR